MKGEEARKNGLIMKEEEARRKAVIVHFVLEGLRDCLPNHVRNEARIYWGYFKMQSFGIGSKKQFFAYKEKAKRPLGHERAIRCCNVFGLPSSLFPRFCSLYYLFSFFCESTTFCNVLTTGNSWWQIASRLIWRTTASPHQGRRCGYSMYVTWGRRSLRVHWVSELIAQWS